MDRSGKGKNVASVLKYHGKMWYNFAVPHFAVPNSAPANPPPPPPTVLSLPSHLPFPLLLSVTHIHAEPGPDPHA